MQLTSSLGALQWGIQIGFAYETSLFANSAPRLISTLNRLLT
jgi:hypothetical protein